MQNGLLFELKYAARLLRKTASNSLLSALVVALSVGLALFVFVMDYAIAFKPLPFEGSDKWVSIQIAQKQGENSRARVDEYTYQEMLKHSSKLDHIGAFGGREAVLSEGEESETLRAAVISPGLLREMKVKPEAGRLFDESDAQSSSVRSAIISHSAWTTYFSSDNSIIGKSVRIDAEPVRIIGIMPADFFAFQDYELWFPYSPRNMVAPDEAALELSPFVKLKPGQGLDDVRSEVSGIVSNLNKSNAQFYGADRSADAVPAYRIYSHANMPVIFVSGIIALAVLILGGINISMIFYARMLERSRELALRAALGASKARLLRQSLIETVVVIAIGFAFGILFALIGVDWGQSIREFPARILATGLSMDYPELRIADVLIAMLAACAIWLASTLLPAWYVLKQDPAKVIAGSGKGVSTSQKRSRSATVLVALQVMISSALLFISLSLVFAIANEASKPKGLQVKDIYVSTEPTTLGSSYQTATQKNNYFQQLESAISSSIANSQTGFATALPSRPGEMALFVENQGMSESGATPQIPVTEVSDSYFPLLGIKLKSGRLFDATDTETTTPVAVIDEVIASRYWPNQDPVGKRMRLGADTSARWSTVVGVVSHVAGQPYSGDPGLVYLSIRQTSPSAFYAITKVPQASTSIPKQIRMAAFSVDRDVPLHNLQKFDDVLEALDIGYASIVPVFSVIVGITILLAASGLFGLISRSVAQRTQEVGIRRALGSTKSGIMRLFMRQSILHLIIAFVGGAIGVALTSMMTAVIPNALASVVIVVLAVVSIMFLVVFSASYLPSRRAVNLEPSEALRYE